MAGKKHLRRSKLTEHVPSNRLCRCGKLGGPPRSCPLAEILPGTKNSKLCNCCKKCRTQCFMEV